MPGRVIPERTPARVDDVHRWIAERTHETPDSIHVDWVEEHTRTEVDRLILEWIRQDDRRDPR